MTGLRTAARSWRRWALGVGALAVLFAAGIYGADRALGTCEFLDRWLGRSGCVANRLVADYRPLGFHTMVAAGDTAVRLFGYDGLGSKASSVQIAVDWASGREMGRTPLPFGPLGFLIRPSRDGARVAAICTANDACSVRRPQGYVLDAASGAVAEELALAHYIDWNFPGARPSGVIGFEAAVAGGGELLVDPDPHSGGLRLRRLADRSEVARLAPPDPYEAGSVTPSGSSVRASASGRFVALIDNRRLYPSGGGSRVDVWDMAERKLVRSLVTDARHRIDTNAAWTADERHLAAVQNWDDTTAAERANGTPLYVFQLR